MSRFAVWSLAAAAVALGLAIQFSRGDDPAPAPSKGPQRLIHDVVMVERDRHSGKTVRIEGREATEDLSGRVRMRQFTAHQENGGTITATEALYDRARSVIELSGSVIVEAKDGSRARLSGLVWDKTSDSARSVGPVDLEAKGSTVTARVAEFEDDFTTIHLSGGVHAEIDRDILDL